MAKTFESDGVYAGIPYRVLSNGKIDIMLNGTVVRLRDMDELLNVVSGLQHRAALAPETSTRPRSKRWISKTLAAVFVVAVVAVLVGSNSVNQDVLKGLKADVAACQKRVDTMQQAGLIHHIILSTSSADVVVNEPTWNASEYNTKVAAALYVYCIRSPADGRFTVYVKGLRDNEIKGSVMNGNWWSK